MALGALMNTRGLMELVALNVGYIRPRHPHTAAVRDPLLHGPGDDGDDLAAVDAGRDWTSAPSATDQRAAGHDLEPVSRHLASSCRRRVHVLEEPLGTPLRQEESCKLESACKESPLVCVRTGMEENKPAAEQHKDAQEHAADLTNKQTEERP